jgi:rubrerythrin
VKKPTDLGMNRTGVSSSPRLVREMLKGMEGLPTKAKWPDRALLGERQQYVQEADAVGSVPPPTGVRGMARSLGKMLKGEKATVLVDKLGERLAFERTGTRLYEQFLVKLESLGESPGGPTVAAVRSIRDDEQHHFDLVRRAIERLGADPTVETPSADVEAVASSGFVKVMSDPRTGIREGLQVLLHAERADQDGWELLVDLCDGLDEPEFSEEFKAAQETEVRHIAHVRQWLRELTLAEAGESLADVDGADEA